MEHDKTKVDFPAQFEAYEQGSQSIVYPKLEGQAIAFDGSTQVEQINLNDVITPQTMFIAIDFTPQEEKRMVLLLKECEYVLTWNHKNMKNISPKVGMHTIPMQADMCLVF